MPEATAHPEFPSISPDLLLRAYANAIFPMADPVTGVIEWYRPRRRGVIRLDRFHVPKNLARLIRQKRFEIRSDTAFESVIRACAEPRDSDNPTWINETLIRAYAALHAEGHAHSIEAWRGGRLVGGLYGVHLEAAFFGESMFIRPDLGGTNASKVCLVYLVRWLRHRGFLLLDTQFQNRHLAQFGCTEIPHVEYQRQLNRALRNPVTWGRFRPLAESPDTPPS